MSQVVLGAKYYGLGLVLLAVSKVGLKELTRPFVYFLLADKTAGPAKDQLVVQVNFDVSPDCAILYSGINVLNPCMSCRSLRGQSFGSFDAFSPCPNC